MQHVSGEDSRPASGRTRGALHLARPQTSIRAASLRSGLAFVGAVLVAGLVGSPASAQQVHRATLALSCKADSKLALVGKKPTCLKAGQACSAKQQSDY